MKKLLLILLCVPLIGFGQGWETTFGGASADVGQSVQQTTDGGYIITGLTHSYGNGNGSSDVYLLKTDAYGVEQWSQTFGGTDDDEGKSVQQTTDGGYIITGYTTSFANGDDVYLIKTDVNGVELWSQTFGGTDDDEGKSVQQTTDGGYIITGRTESGFSFYTCLIKTDGNGIEQWTENFGSTHSSFSYSVKQTADGGYIITGSDYNLAFNHDLYLIKTDGNGIEQWSQIFLGVGDDIGRSVQQTTDGGYIITGSTESLGSGGLDVYLIKTDGNGTEQWSKTFGGTDDDEGKSVQQTTDGGYIITGTTGGWGFSDIYLIKTDGNGNITSTFNIPINPNRNLQKTVDILGKETKPQTNTPFIEIYDDGTVEKRIVIE